MLHCAFLAAALVACARREQPAAPALRPVSLPDLSNTSQPVQSQLRERYASMQASLAKADATPGDRASAYGDMGTLLMAAEYLDAAEPCFLNARTLSPSDMRWPYYLGHLNRFRNQPGQAAAQFEAALALQPSHVPSLVWLGEMHLLENKPAAATPVFMKALSIDPRSGAARHGLGRAELAKQDYAQAVKELEEALVLAPKASRIHYPLALAYRGLGDQRKAEAHLKQRGDVEVPPADPLMEHVGGLLQNASAYEVRGAEALAARQWPEAVAQLRKAIEIAPDNPMTRLNLGNALYLSGDAAGAKTELEAAIRLSPGLAKAHYSLGVLLETDGHDREAIDQYSAAIASEPGFAEARMQLADALRRSGRSADALPHYAAVLNSSPSASQAAFGRAMSFVQLARYRDARDELGRATKAYPDQAGFAHALARVLAAAPDDGVRDGTTALAIVEQLWKGQQTVALAETMAMALAEVGRFDEAVSWQNDAVAGMRREARVAEVPGMLANLALYQRLKPCRTPWRPEDPVFHPRSR